MVSCFAPDIVTLRAESIYRDGTCGKRKTRTWCADYMKDRQLRGHVFDLHVIGDDVALESCLKSRLKRGIGIEDKRIRFRAHE